VIESITLNNLPDYYKENLLNLHRCNQTLYTKHNNAEHICWKYKKSHDNSNSTMCLPVSVFLLVHFSTVHTVLFFHSVNHTDRQSTLSTRSVNHGITQLIH